MKFEPAEADYEAMVREKIGGNHFSQFVGINIHDIKAGEINARLEIQPQHRQQMGFVHGGVTATFADVVMGFAAFTLVKKGQGVVTADLRLSYLNPGVGDVLYAKGFVIKAGQKLIFCEAELWMMDGEKRIEIAKASSTMMPV